MKVSNKKAVAFVLSIVLFLTSVAFTPFLSSCMSDNSDDNGKARNR